MATVYAPLVTFLFFISTTTPKVAAAITLSKRLATRLIHRDSILSPYYNSSCSITDRAQRSRADSIARFAYLQSKIEGVISAHDVQAHLHPTSSNSLFLLKMSVGQPPISQLTIMDTGSSLTWIQCIPCENCSRQSGPIFNPSKSSTYANLPCNSPKCSWNDGYCDYVNDCPYTIRYVSTFTSEGVLATEKITFETSDEGTIDIPNMIIGCSHENGNFNDPHVDGLFGLGYGMTSWVAHLGSRFSYCIGNIEDPNYIHNQLIFGDGAIIQGDSTPLEVFRGFYYIVLESISVGEKMLDINPHVFTRVNRKGGVIMDSGSEHTWLIKDAYDALCNEVRSLLDGFLRRFDNWLPWLCYYGRLDQDLTGFPVVTFHFSGGAELTLEVGSMFLQYLQNPDVFCMAIIPSENWTIIGVLAQQYYNIAYDIDGKKFSFRRIDCELLED